MSLAPADGNTSQDTQEQFVSALENTHMTHAYDEAADLLCQN